MSFGCNIFSQHFVDKIEKNLFSHFSFDGQYTLQREDDLFVSRQIGQRFFLEIHFLSLLLPSRWSDLLDDWYDVEEHSEKSGRLK